MQCRIWTITHGRCLLRVCGGCDCAYVMAVESSFWLLSLFFSFSVSFSFSHSPPSTSLSFSLPLSSPLCCDGCNCTTCNLFVSSRHSNHEHGCSLIRTVRLDRVLPFVLAFCQDPLPSVRSAAIAYALRSLSNSLLAFPWGGVSLSHSPSGNHCSPLIPQYVHTVSAVPNWVARGRSQSYSREL